jgi:hypothetical protein
MHNDQDQLSHVSDGLAEVLARLEAAREASSRSWTARMATWLRFARR